MGKPNAEPNISPPGEENAYRDHQKPSTLKYITLIFVFIVTITGLTIWQTSRDKIEKADVAVVAEKSPASDEYEIKGAYFNDSYQYHRDDIAGTGYFNFDATFERNGEKMLYDVWVPKGRLGIAPRDDGQQITTLSLKGINEKPNYVTVDYALISAPAEDVAKWQSYITNIQNEPRYFNIMKRAHYTKDTDVEDIVKGNWGLRKYDGILSVMIQSTVPFIDFEFEDDWSNGGTAICFSFSYILIYMNPFGIEAKTGISLKGSQEAVVYLPDGLAKIEKIDDGNNIDKDKRRELMVDDLMHHDLYRIFAKRAIIYVKDEVTAQRINEGLEKLRANFKPQRVVPDSK